MPVFDAGGSAKRTIQSDILHERLVAAGVRCELLQDHPAVINRITELAHHGDIIVTMGARDPDIPVTAQTLANC